MSAVLRWPTMSRPRRIQPDRRSSSRRPLACSTAAARPLLRLAGSSTTSSVPALRASAASRPSRSPTWARSVAGSRPSGRSSTSTSTVRAASSEPAMASASSSVGGVRTTSHSGAMPRATASTGSNARARSSQATMAPPAWAAAAVRSASVVLPDDASPRSATVAERGSPPVPRMASSAANPVETTRPSASGVGAGVGIGARASAPSVSSAAEPEACGPHRRGAAEPQRACSAARVRETSSEGVIGRRIVEHMFDMSRVQMADATLTQDSLSAARLGPGGRAWAAERSTWTPNLSHRCITRGAWAAGPKTAADPTRPPPTR